MEDWIERFELSSIAREVKKENQTVCALTNGGRLPNSVMKNFVFSRSPPLDPFYELKTLMLGHLIPINLQEMGRAKFHTWVPT